MINASRPHFIWVGLAKMRDRLDPPLLIGIGVAFDFHAGRKWPRASSSAPASNGCSPHHRAAPAVAAVSQGHSGLLCRVRTYHSLGGEGGPEHPHDTPPYLLMPSPIFAHSFQSDSLV
jgi:hypothetical protein